MNVDDTTTGHGSGSSQNYLTLLIYPHNSSSYKYYTSESNHTEIQCDEHCGGYTISFSQNTGSVIIRLKNNIEPDGIRLNTSTGPLERKNSFSAFEASSSGWFHGKMRESENIYTWIKFTNPADSVYVNTSISVLSPTNYESAELNVGIKIM